MLDFETAIRQLESSDTYGHAAASADMASAVWNGRVPHEKVLELLMNGSNRVRECLAWAVWDAKTPKPALEFLLAHGSEDTSEVVRNYALKAWLDLRPPLPLQQSGFSKFLSDENVSIRGRARSLLESCEGTEM